MSHFSLLVVCNKSDKLEDLLDPYDESKHTTFIKENSKKDFEKEYNTIHPFYKNIKTGELIETWYYDIVKEDKVNYKAYSAHFSEKYPTLDDYVKSYYGYVKNENNEYGYYANTNAKWDWWIVGGRWSNSLTLKSNRMCDSAVAKDIDFDRMFKDKKEKANKNYDDFEKNYLNTTKAGREAIHPYFEYGIENIGTRDNYIPESRESYIQKCSVFTFAILDKTGWKEKGEAGWFGISINNKENKIWLNEYETYIKQIKPNKIVTVVDCHI